MSSNRKQTSTINSDYKISPNAKSTAFKMNSVAWKTTLIGIIFLVALSFLPLNGLADSYAGGIPPVTEQTGVVSGGLYVDAAPAPDWGLQDVTKEFTIPNYTSIEWARLYVTVYCGHMQSNYHGNATISMDYTGDDAYDGTPWFEDLNVENPLPMYGGDMYVTVNDHCNRVTSDYLMWYDVTSLINKTNLTVNVLTQDVDLSFDGRIKVITLAVAYNNDTSGKTIQYWVNEGHDTSSYYYREGELEEYVGETIFEDVPSGWTKANLTVNHMASADGFYWFNGTLAAPVWNGTTLVPFGGNLNPYLVNNGTGPYSGYDVWNVTSVLKTGDNILYYSRNHTATGYGGNPWYKLPLAFLEVTY